MDTLEKINYYAELYNINGEIATPKNICTDMVNMLDTSVYDNMGAKYLDIYCKSGRFLKAIYDKLISSEILLKHFNNNIDKLKEEILNNYLYGITPSEMTAAIIRKELYGDPNHIGNIIVIEDYKTKMKNNNFGRNPDGSVKTFRDEINERFGQGMKFDEVIGNPPYNNDLYIDFVGGGYNLIKDDGCAIMITPAKWQAKGGKKNEDFRKDIVPHMSKIYQYHNCIDVFDIQETSGICYYIIDKGIHIDKEVINKCKNNKSLQSNGEIHRENPLILYPQKFISIVEKCRTSKQLNTSLSFKRCIFVGEQERGNIIRINEDDAEVLQGSKVTGYIPKSELYTHLNLTKWKVTTLIMISMQVIFGKYNKVLGSPAIHILKPNQVPKGSFPCLRYFNTENECKSFKSYIESKLISFLFFMGVCGGTLTSEFFRFVPDPGPFDHIFTDEELYKKYNLTPEEINIIESVIKERT